MRAAIDRVTTSKAANSLRGYAGDWSVWCHATAALGPRSMAG